jgi:trans-aconitate 2-methyltransferase
MTGHSPEWDSKSYHRVSTPHVSWGKKVLARLSLRGDETVLDAGCGTGLLTAELLELLPRGRVVGIDLSQNMLDTAAQHIGSGSPSPHRAVFVRADVSHLPFRQSFDGVFSTATFHWVLDHDRLFRSIFQALRPGGWLCAQCGGGPNIARFLSRVEVLAATPPYSQYLAGYRLPCEFSDAETDAARLRGAGFIGIETSLEEAPTTFSSAPEFCKFVSTAILRTHFEQIPTPAIRESFVNELAALAATDHPPYHVDYWRLNLQARKPA